MPGWIFRRALMRDELWERYEANRGAAGRSGRSIESRATCITSPIGVEVVLSSGSNVRPERENRGEHALGAAALHVFVTVIPTACARRRNRCFDSGGVFGGDTSNGAFPMV